MLCYGEEMLGKKEREQISSRVQIKRKNSKNVFQTFSGFRVNIRVKIISMANQSLAANLTKY